MAPKKPPRVYRKEHYNKWELHPPPMDFGFHMDGTEMTKEEIEKYKSYKGPRTTHKRQRS